MSWEKHQGDTRTPEAPTITVTTRENNPGFFIQFLEIDIFDKKIDGSAAIFYRVNTNNLKPTFFSKTPQILFEIISECSS
jgi:hypothetical protein